jgi:2-methylcitrate dehydratase PrpD
MGSIAKNNFSEGWNPSADAFNVPPNALLRMDNCVLDELGAVALRKGSAKISAAALSATDVHSLFTTSLSGTRYRMAGAGSTVFSNGTSVATSVAGSGDIAFGASQGQIRFARSTTTKKYDGTTVRNWGIAAVGAAPTLTTLSADSKTFASCASTESPIMTQNEGTSRRTRQPGAVLPRKPSPRLQTSRPTMQARRVLTKT